MEHFEWVVTLAAIISGGVVVWKAVEFFVHLMDKLKKFDDVSAKVSKIDELSDDVKEIKQHCQEDYLGILRLTVMSDEMPIGERIVAADKYLKAGGNGDVKKFIEAELHTKEVHRE